MTQDDNKRQAVALSYQQELDSAPRVVAKGHASVADKLISIAKEHHIPIQEDESLVQLLNQVELNHTIPSELYGVVAELFAFIYKIDHSIK